jgi:hypothetical protein
VPEASPVELQADSPTIMKTRPFPLAMEWVPIRMMEKHLINFLGLPTFLFMR